MLPQAHVGEGGEELVMLYGIEGIGVVNVYSM
jgi:hypothetical protein